MSFVPPPPPTPGHSSPGKARPVSMVTPGTLNSNGGFGGAPRNDDDDDDDDDDGGVPEPPATVGNWTFAMKGMFPAPRPWNGGHKTYASGNETGGGIGYKV